MLPLKKSPGGVVVTGLMLAFLGACIVGIWLRNRDMLRDLYDYTLVVTVAGKVEAGLKPYSDVRSPIQSAIYLLNYGTEQVFGRNYLALTWGGLAQALGGALLLWGMLRSSLGGLAATLVALAVSLAGLIQHTVFFYNPIGILCLSVVVLGLAVEPVLGAGRAWKTAAICAALFLGGINKLNFHGAALVCAGLFTLAAGVRGRMGPGVVGRNILLLALFGCVLPLAFELAWTGATFSEWLDNVVRLPAQRHGYLGLALDPKIYLRPPHDYYHHIPIRAIGGIGLLLLLGTGAWLLDEARANRAPLADWILRLLLVLAGAGLGALLIVTNHETIMLTSLAYPVMAAALYLHYRGSGRPAERWMERLILGAMVIWAGTGGYAAWHGSRVLYGPNPPAWSSYVRMHSEARALAYFNGVKMPPEQISAWELTAARLKSLEGPDGRIEGMLFGPGVEWLERAYPGNIVRHAAIGYLGGITLNDGDLNYMKDVCLGGGQRRLVAQKGWQSWPGNIREMLERDYRREDVGSRDVMYHPRGPRPPPAEVGPDIPPAVYRDKVTGNILITSTRISRGMGLHDGVQGGLFGATENSNWSWPLGTGDFRGWAVAQLAPGREHAGVVVFRIIDGDPETGATWEKAITVGPAQREVAEPFVLVPAGRPVWLQTYIREEDRGTLVGGWREMRITRSNEQDQSPPLPYATGLQLLPPAGTGEKARDELWYARGPEALRPEGWVGLPAENWRRMEMRPGIVRVQVEFGRDGGEQTDRAVLILGWYRASRFEIMTEKEIDLRSTRSATIEAWVTEPGGWVGLLARGWGAGYHMRITAWEKLPLP